MKVKKGQSNNILCSKSKAPISTKRAKYACFVPNCTQKFNAWNIRTPHQESYVVVAKRFANGVMVKAACTYPKF